MDPEALKEMQESQAQLHVRSLHPPRACLTSAAEKHAVRPQHRRQPLRYSGRRLDWVQHVRRKREHAGQEAQVAQLGMGTVGFVPSNSDLLPPSWIGMQASDVQPNLALAPSTASASNSGKLQ
jgi:hypothetical protein